MESLGLEEPLCMKLKEADVKSAEDLKKRDLRALCYELELSADEVDKLYSAVYKDNMPRMYNGLELLRRGPTISSIPTFCEAFNVLLSSSGIPTGKIIEFCGSPGSGKTQLGLTNANPFRMQLAINVQLSSRLSSVEVEALYVDTEGGFNIHRAQDIAQSMVDRMKEQSAAENAQCPTANDLLSKIHFFRIYSHFELLAFLTDLPDIIETYPKIRIIIIDTITFHLRTNIRDLTAKGKIIKTILELLRKTASSSNVAVVIMNQMTTFKDGRTIIPALGERWGQRIDCRIQLSEDYNGRYAIRIKPRAKATFRQPFSITSQGIRNAEGNLDETVEEDTTSTSLIQLSSGVAEVDIAEKSAILDASMLNDEENQSILFIDDILQEATQNYAGHKRPFEAIDDDDDQEYSDADVLCFASQDYY
ncbi:hypothetical protein INT44_007157 [Umbelopsis vinacea]|uniref:DNA repair protein RAD51 homolog 3 n=1 Tax=Umbelopsis vinacea TaxID=44442 RepID=A0A8H7PHX5_9FUNG|nr:hypothetical protein INT44_007157 [Umbelopsis vinacea]